MIPDARWVLPCDYDCVSFAFSFALSASTPFRYLALAAWTGCYLEEVCMIAEDF